MEVGTLTALWRYPVKSMGGESVRAADVGPVGVAGDRAFAVVDDRTDKVLSAKTVPRLLEAHASWVQECVRIRSDDGLDLDANQSDAAATLSSWLGRPVHLASPAPGELLTSPGAFFDSRSSLHLVSGAASMVRTFGHRRGHGRRPCRVDGSADHGRVVRADR